MGRNPGLDESVAIFTELGWADATYADAPTLPLGTPAQRRAALPGLRTGDWDRWGHAWGRPPVADVDLSMLWLFAVRVGVSARRAAELYQLPLVPDLHDAAFTVLVERGPTFAQTFVKNTDHHLSFSSLPVRLVDHFRLPVPQEWNYMVSWALQVRSLVDEWQRQHVVPVSGRILQDRYVEHVRTAYAAGLTGESTFNRALNIGMAQGWIDRDEVIGLEVAALDAASGTGRWGRLLTLDELHVSDEEIVAHTDTLVPVLAGGAGPATDAFVIERLAPVLIAGASDDTLADVATAALTAPTKKALRVVLKALADRPRPSAETVGVLGPQVTALDPGRDRALARLVQAIANRWGLACGAPAEPRAVEGLWRPVPPVWTPPRFDRGDETPEALTQVAAELVARGESGTVDVLVDVTVERFLALANAVARRDVELARTALRGMAGPGVAGDGGWGTQVGPWLTGDPCPRGQIDDLLTARTRAVLDRLGQVPCLLSEPSTVDLRITPADLADRLRAYQAGGVGACEVDLLLALTRLDVALADDAVQAELDRLTVPVLPWLGAPTPLTAGPVACRYLTDPALEPDPVHRKVKDCRKSGLTLRWDIRQWTVPVSLRDLPASRLLCGPMDVPAVFPTWNDMVLRDPGLELRQVARRAVPLPPDVMANVLVALRDPPPGTVSDAAVAIREAWDRGLLRPGTADVRCLDQRLGATARALGDAAREGPLAAVWPILDDLLVVAAAAPRLMTGTVDVVETVAALLPEVQHAVATGRAEPTVLDLPGVRALAGRAGSSQPVRLSREIVAGLPAPTDSAAALPDRTEPEGAKTRLDGRSTVIDAVQQEAEATSMGGRGDGA